LPNFFGVIAGQLLNYDALASSARSMDRSMEKQRMASTHGKRRGPRDDQRMPQAPGQAVQDPVIGYFAFRGMEAVCDGDGCVIAGSRDEMAKILKQWGRDHFTIKATTLSEILWGVRRGGAYCFDEQAYGRFLAPGRKAGLPLSEEDFSEPGPTGLHFVRIQLSF